MLDHSGKSRVRYEDAFRAFGNYLDENRFSQIVMVETPQGFLIKGQTAAESGTGGTVLSFPETYLFSNDDIDNLLQSAYDRRQQRD
jgi:hypothetical protein